MADVEIRVNGRDYRIACEDGQEHHVRQLAAYFDNTLTRIAADLGQIGDARLMLLTALTLCDEMFELKDRVADLEKAGDALDPSTAGAAGRAVRAAASRIREITAQLGGSDAA